MRTKLLLIMAILTVISCATLFAASDRLPLASTNDNTIQKRVVNTREVEYSFGITPTTLLFSYYDYMQGGYHSLPMCIQTPETGGGAYITFHGQRTASGIRRVHYTYLNESGTIVNNNEITSTQVREGYPAIDLDDQTGKPFFAWHSDFDDNSVDEVRFTWDAYLEQIPGLINDPTTCINNPITLHTNNTTTTDNEFIWPVVKVGPSPNAGMKRVHVMGYNYTEHTGGSATENNYFAYADFNQSMMENGEPLTWAYSSIPEMDAWNNDTVEWRRGFYSLVVGENGKVYVIGYHVAFDANDHAINEPTMQCFINDNYGAGEWRVAEVDPDIPAWNPPTANGTGPGLFADDADVPYTDAELWWGPVNSAHVNAVQDNNGMIHFPALYSLNNVDDTYFSNLQYMRDIQFNMITETFNATELYPQGLNPHDDNPYTPWDLNEDHVVDEFYTEGSPVIETIWPFMYWDDTAMGEKMMFHCNHIKMSEPNAQDMMVCTWSDSWRARQMNSYGDTDYTAYADVPELYIAVSPDNGYTWSEPIIINSIETPEFAGEKPVFPYPADKVIYTGMDNEGRKLGRLFMMYFDDNSWGPYASTDGVGSNDGGNVKYMALDITFPLSTANEESTVPDIPVSLSQNYPNPFNPDTSIRFNLPKAGNVSLQVYNIKGQLVKTLVDSRKSAGEHIINWNGTDNHGKQVSTGVYYYTLSKGKSQMTRKMILMK